VNNAGSASKVLNPRFISEDEWNATVNINLTAVFNLTQAVLEDMIAKQEGTVITVSSLAVINPNLLGGAAYGAGKAGVKNFMTFLTTSIVIRASVRRRSCRARPTRPPWTIAHGRRWKANGP
jgi:NADP-dependent 3-hydroxy acid dehydrogenase YdfG